MAKLKYKWELLYTDNIKGEKNREIIPAKWLLIVRIAELLRKTTNEVTVKQFEL